MAGDSRAHSPVMAMDVEQARILVSCIGKEKQTTRDLDKEVTTHVADAHTQLPNRDISATLDSTNAGPMHAYTDSYPNKQFRPYTPGIVSSHAS